MLVVAGLLALGVALVVPAVAETQEDDFLKVAPLPDGIGAVEPIPGAVNVQFQDCEAVWPDGYRAWRTESIATEGHAALGDIYGWLRTKGAFEARACDCAAKVAPWDQVEVIYAALKSRYGQVLLKHTAVYEDQARQYRAAVERMCGGPF
ncbi:MAG: hypothetical protein ACRCSW_01340 [Tabrizicola sp.]